MSATIGGASAAAIGSRGLNDVFFVGIAVDENLQRLIETSERTRVLPAVNLLVVAVVGDHLAVLYFEGAAETGLHQISRDCQLVDYQLGAREGTANLLGVKLLFKRLELAVRLI